MFPALTIVEKAILLDHDPEKLGKPSESNLEWQPKASSKYAHHDSRTEDAYLLCFQSSQSLKRLFLGHDPESNLTVTAQGNCVIQL